MEAWRALNACSVRYATLCCQSVKRLIRLQFPKTPEPEVTYKPASSAPAQRIDVCNLILNPRRSEQSLW